MLKELRITDKYLRRQVTEEARRRGDKVPTKTAGRLIAERLAQLEQMRAAEALHAQGAAEQKVTA